MTNKETTPAYILGVDMGVASIGLALLEAAPDGRPLGIMEGFVRTWPVPEGASGRREKRAMRRNLARRRRRLDRVRHILQEAGMLGSPRSNASPVALRAKASRMEVSKQELAEAILHIAKHRGKPDMRRRPSSDDDAKETGMVNEGIKTLKSEIERLQFGTYGQYLRWREKKGLSTRIKPRSKANAKGEEYPFYPSREMLMEEFDAIWARQREATPEAPHLTEALQSQLRDEVFFQRDVTFPPPGDCPYNPDEPRLAKASRLFQERRIYEAANHLRFHDRFGNSMPYDVRMRDQVVEALMGGHSLKPSDIKTLLGMPRTAKVNYEAGEVPREIEGNPIDPAFETAGIGGEWAALSGVDQDAVLATMVKAPNVQWLREQLAPYFPAPDALESALSVSLPKGHGRMGVSATRATLDVLKREFVPARVAEDRAGLSHAMTPDGEIHERLPYYGKLLEAHTVKPTWESCYRRGTDTPPTTNENERRYGRIPNPVVHVAMNQLRRVVNEVISTYSRPLRIHVELARDLQRSQEDRDEIAERNEKRGRENATIREKLTKLGMAGSRPNVQRYRLWQEQQFQCIYTGEAIRESRLFSEDVDIDHVIPRALLGYGVTINAIDSMNNRVVCLRRANADKGNKTPHEAFSASADGYDWGAIMRRVKVTGGSKERRFLANARDEFTREDDHRARDGTDTAYIARITRQYLSCLYGDQNHVMAVSSHVTSLLRGKWGLNSVLGNGEAGYKSRDDHRHHYVDALVAACVNNSVIQSIHTESKRCSHQGLGDFVKKIDPPFGEGKAFRSAVKASLDGVRTARKTDHAIGGQMHEDTLYGIESGPDEQGRYITVQRKELRDYDTFAALGKARIQATLLDASPFKEAQRRIEEVQTAVLAHRARATDELLAEIQEEVTEGKKDRKPSERAIYRRAVKLHSEDETVAKSFELFERRYLVNVRMSGNQAIGGYVSWRNHRVEFYADRKGVVRMEPVSMMYANTPSFVPPSALPGHRLIWKAHKDDTLEMDDPSEPDRRRTFLVVKFNAGKLGVVPIFDARPAVVENKRVLFEKGCRFFCEHRAQRVVTNALGTPLFRFDALPEAGKIPP